MSLKNFGQNQEMLGISDERNIENQEKRKISLVYAKVDSENFAQYVHFPSMGIYSLYDSLKKHLKDPNINSVDLNQKDNYIESWGDYACFSINSFNFQNSIKLVEQAKKAGAVTIVGGVHPTLVKEKMLKSKFIDYVIVGEGEKSLTELIKGDLLEDIPGLIYRKGDETVKNPGEIIDINEASVNYKEMYKSGELVADKRFGKVLPYYSQRGCLWREQSGGCLFCSIPDPDKVLRNKDPKKIWPELIELCKKYKPDIIWDICDSFAGNKKWVREMAQTKPSMNMPPWFSYIRAKEVIDEETVNNLSEIGFKYVFIGFESGDDQMLKNLIKGTSVKTNIKAVEKLAEKDIKVLGTFVLGAPGETRETLQNSYELAQKLHKMSNIHSITANTLIPYMGSKAFNLILQKLKERNEIDLYNRYAEEMYIPLEELQKEYLRLACPQITYKDLSEFEEKINQLNKEEGPRLLPRKPN